MLSAIRSRVVRAARPVLAHGPRRAASAAAAASAATGAAFWAAAALRRETPAEEGDQAAGAAKAKVEGDADDVSPLEAERLRRERVRTRRVGAEALDVPLHGEALAIASAFEGPQSAGGLVDDVLRKYTLPVVAIMAANTGVFGAWRLLPNSFMMRHFTLSVQNMLQYRAATLPTLMTSAFSHHSPMHFLFNMIAFSSIAPPLVKVLGPADFTTFYLGACATSSAFWTGVHYLQALARRRDPLAMMQWLRTPALGASGGVVGCFAVLANLMPHAKMHIIFLPMFSFSAKDAFYGLMAIDTAGMAAQFKYRGVWGHSAHFGGGVAGMLYYKHLQKSHPTVRQIEAGRMQQARWADYRRRGRPGGDY